MFSGIPHSTIFSALKYVPQIPYFAFRCSSGALVVDQWDPPDKSYDHISCLPDNPIVIVGWGFQFQGKETYLGEMHFLTLFSIGPRTKNNFVQYEFPRNAFFVKHPSVQCTYIRKKFCDISCYVVRLITPSLHVNGHIATLCQRTKNHSDNHNVMIYILGTKNILHNNDVLNLMDFKDPVIHILLSTRKQSVFWGKLNSIV